MRLLDDLLRLTYIQNEGSAFGLFQGNRWFFIGVSVLSILVILSLGVSGRYRDRGMSVAFGLILGGAAGNLIDRIWLGKVIDFIEMGIGRYRWPVYNVADMGVTIGVILLALRLMVDSRRARGDQEADAPRADSEAGVPPEPSS